MRSIDRSHSKPQRNSSEEYLYAGSAKIFVTEQLFFSSEKVEPGKRASAPHFHKEIDEIIYVISGELHAHEGEEAAVLTVGDSVCFSSNSGRKHYLENKTGDSAEFLVIRQNLVTDDTAF